MEKQGKILAGWAGATGGDGTEGGGHVGSLIDELMVKGVGVVDETPKTLTETHGVSAPRGLMVWIYASVNFQASLTAGVAMDQKSHAISHRC